jgi:hypothetical protein
MTTRKLSSALSELTNLAVLCLQCNVETEDWQKNTVSQTLTLPPSVKIFDLQLKFKHTCDLGRGEIYYFFGKSISVLTSFTLSVNPYDIDCKLL